MKKFYDKHSGEEIKPGDKVRIVFEFPEKLIFGRSDKVLEDILKNNNGSIEKINNS